MAKRPVKKSTTEIPKTGSSKDKSTLVKPVVSPSASPRPASSLKKSTAKISASTLNAVVFLLFAVGGMILLILVKGVVPTEQNDAQALGNIFWVSLITPLLILSAYLLCCWNFDALNTRKDQTGDNLYYLGFIFTLGSLAYSLLDLNALENILVNFGNAVWSTLWGIVLRTAVNQLRFDPNEVEEASRQELSEASRRVAKELNQSVEEFDTFRKVSQQLVGEGFKDTQKNIEDISSTIMESLRSTSEKSAEPINKMINVSSKAIEAMSNQIEKFASNTEKFSERQEKLLQATLKIAEAMEKFSEEYRTKDTIGASIRQTIAKTTEEQSVANRLMMERIAKQRLKAQKQTKADPDDLVETPRPNKRKRNWIFEFLFGKT